MFDAETRRQCAQRRGRKTVVAGSGTDDREFKRRLPGVDDQGTPSQGGKSGWPRAPCHVIAMAFDRETCRARERALRVLEQEYRGKWSNLAFDAPELVASILSVRGHDRGILSKKLEETLMSMTVRSACHQ